MLSFHHRQVAYRPALHSSRQWSPKLEVLRHFQSRSPRHWRLICNELLHSHVRIWSSSGRRNTISRRSGLFRCCSKQGTFGNVNCSAGLPFQTLLLSPPPSFWDDLLEALLSQILMRMWRWAPLCLFRMLRYYILQEKVHIFHNHLPQLDTFDKYEQIVCSSNNKLFWQTQGYCWPLGLVKELSNLLAAASTSTFMQSPAFELFVLCFEVASSVWSKDFSIGSEEFLLSGWLMGLGTPAWSFQCSNTEFARCRATAIFQSLSFNQQVQE